MGWGGQAVAGEANFAELYNIHIADLWMLRQDHRIILPMCVPIFLPIWIQDVTLLKNCS
jgi:hypothetical protein